MEELLKQILAEMQKQTALLQEEHQKATYHRTWWYEVIKVQFQDKGWLNNLLVDRFNAIEGRLVEVRGTTASMQSALESLHRISAFSR